jgi:hypothetical protein
MLLKVPSIFNAVIASYEDVEGLLLMLSMDAEGFYIQQMLHMC